MASDVAAGISFARVIELCENDPGQRVTAKTRANRAGMFGILKEIVGASRPQITCADARRVDLDTRSPEL